MIFMKKIIFAAFAFFLFSTMHAHTVNTVHKYYQSSPNALLVKEYIHDFGSIPQGKPIYYYFEIMNKGATSLKLENVQASCGCTTPEWNREPIPAGSSDKIKVGYNAAA